MLKPRCVTFAADDSRSLDSSQPLIMQLQNELAQQHKEILKVGNLGFSFYKLDYIFRRTLILENQKINK